MKKFVFVMMMVFASIITFGQTKAKKNHIPAEERLELQHRFQITKAVYINMDKYYNIGGHVKLNVVGDGTELMIDDVDRENYSIKTEICHSISKVDTPLYRVIITKHAEHGNITVDVFELNKLVKSVEMRPNSSYIELRNVVAYRMTDSSFTTYTVPEASL